MWKTCRWNDCVCVYIENVATDSSIHRDSTKMISAREREGKRRRNELRIVYDGKKWQESILS